MQWLVHLLDYLQLMPFTSNIGHNLLMHDIEISPSHIPDKYEYFRVNPI